MIHAGTDFGRSTARGGVGGTDVQPLAPRLKSTSARRPSSCICALRIPPYAAHSARASRREVKLLSRALGALKAQEPHTQASGDANLYTRVCVSDGPEINNSGMSGSAS